MMNSYIPQGPENLLEPSLLAEFKSHILAPASELFTQPLSTTVTMEGVIDGVLFHEEQLIKLLEPDHDVLAYRCNYGHKQYVGWQYVPPPPRKNNRGRKKKERTRKPRKRQGAGTDFNSQITFIVRSRLVHVACADAVGTDGTDVGTDGTNMPVQATSAQATSAQASAAQASAPIVPANAQVYKFKIFRTGKVQLPGAKQTSIDDVIDCLRVVVDILDRVVSQVNGQRAVLRSFSPVMKNYKFAMNMPMIPTTPTGTTMINLEHLRALIAADMTLETDERAKSLGVRTFMIKYSRMDTKLSLKFITPTLSNPLKKTRINVFPRGKINILGAIHDQPTQIITNWLMGLMTSAYHTGGLIVVEGVGVVSIVNGIPIQPEHMKPMTLISPALISPALTVSQAE